MNDMNSKSVPYPEDLPDPLDEVQNAKLWGLASLQSALGSVRGGKIFSLLDPALVVSLWLWVLGEAQDADES